MDIKWLKTFIVAAEFENFRQASEELFLTQPAVTKHIKRLEEALQIELFQRLGKRILLTPAGYKFLPYAKEIFLKYEDGLKEFDLWKQGYKHKLNIAAAPQIAASFLPELLRRFMDTYSNIEVIINVLKSYEIGEEVISGRSDMGITRMKPVQQELAFEVIHGEPVILVASNEEIKDISEKIVLDKYRLITHNHPEYWDDLLQNVKRQYPNVRTMKVGQVDATKRFIEKGLGVSYLPLTMVKDELKKKTLIEVKPEEVKLPTSSTYLLTKIQTEEVDLFTKFIRKVIHELN